MSTLKALSKPFLQKAKQHQKEVQKDDQLKPNLINFAGLFVCTCLLFKFSSCNQFKVTWDSEKNSDDKRNPIKDVPLNGPVFCVTQLSQGCDRLVKAVGTRTPTTCVDSYKCGKANLRCLTLWLPEAINLLLLPTKSIHYSGDEKEALPKYCSVLRYTSKIAYFGEILKQEWVFDVSRELSYGLWWAKVSLKDN